MKVLLLAAGYATRMYPLTLNQPKSLLPLAGRTVIDFILDIIEPLKDVDEIFIVTNQKFYRHFVDWSKKSACSKKITVVNDGTTTNENRLGATGDMNFVIKEQCLKDDVLVLAGDNLFKTDLNKFLNFAISKRPAISIGLYDVKDLRLAKKLGIVSLDSGNKVIEFSEKPEKPASTLAAKCLYFIPKEELRAVGEYLNTDSAKDAPGYFLEWLCKKEPMYGYVFENEKWFDIGDKKSYEEADREFSKA